MPRLTHVSVKQGAGHNLYTPAEFVKLPVSQRIELVLQHRAVFLDEHGKEMDIQEGVAQLPRPTIGR
jgi:hypothetical protein